MKKYLTIPLFILMIVVMKTQLVNADSPQRCKSTLVQALAKYGMNLSDLKNEQKVIEFKKKAKADGCWAQFATICNSPTYKGCEKCTCDYNLSLKACMWNCGCCWGNKRCDAT